MTPNREVEKSSVPPRRNPFDSLIAPVEVGYGVLHFTAIGLPYAALLYGSDRAVEAAKYSGREMARVGLPDTMPIVLKEVEAVKAVTGMDSSSAIAAVFILAALVSADGVRRFRRSLTRR